MVEQWNRDGGPVEQWKIMVDQWKIMVVQWNRYGGIVEQLWRNSGTDMVEQWNSGTDKVERCKRDGGIVEQ